MKIEIIISYKGKTYKNTKLISDLVLEKVRVPFLYCWDILMLTCREIKFSKIL